MEPVDNFQPQDLSQFRVNVDESVLSALQSYDQVLELSFDLLKECDEYLCTLSGLIVGSDEIGITPYGREGAVIVGNLTRLQKLVTSFLLLLHSDQSYSATVLQRPIYESALTILYLVKENSQDEFRRYIRGGLGVVKEIIEFLDSQPGTNPPLEAAMRPILEQIIATSGFQLSEIDVRRDRSWAVNVRQRLTAYFDEPFRGVSPEELVQTNYITMFSGPSAMMHGDWADLILHHLQRVGRGFLPNPTGGSPSPYDMIHFCQLIGACLVCFVEGALPDGEDKEAVRRMLIDFVRRVDFFDNYLLRENFLGRLMFNGDVDRQS
jgi:hypothetical protein